MSAFLRSVTKEMWQTLGGKKSVKEAWEAVKTMRLGADCVKDVNAQKLSKEFENLQFKEGEMIDDFGMRITNLVNLKTLCASSLGASLAWWSPLRWFAISRSSP